MLRRHGLCVDMFITLEARGILEFWGGGGLHRAGMVNYSISSPSPFYGEWGELKDPSV